MAAARTLTAEQLTCLEQQIADHGILTYAEHQKLHGKRHIKSRPLYALGIAALTQDTWTLVREPTRIQEFLNSLGISLAKANFNGFSAILQEHVYGLITAGPVATLCQGWNRMQPDMIVENRLIPRTEQRIKDIRNRAKFLTPAKVPARFRSRGLVPVTGPGGYYPVQASAVFHQLPTPQRTVTLPPAKLRSEAAVNAYLTGADGRPLLREALGGQRLSLTPDQRNTQGRHLRVLVNGRVLGGSTHLTKKVRYESDVELVNGSRSVVIEAKWCKNGSRLAGEAINMMQPYLAWLGRKAQNKVSRRRGPITTLYVVGDRSGLDVHEIVFDGGDIAGARIVNSTRFMFQARAAAPKRAGRVKVSRSAARAAA